MLYHRSHGGGGGSSILGGLLINLELLSGETIGVGLEHGDDEDDADVEEVDEQRRAVA